MPWNLLLLPLLGGYYFIHRFRLLRFRAQRMENQRLLIESAIAGAFWLGIGRFLAVATQHWLPTVSEIVREMLQQLAPFPMAPTAVGATLLAVVSAHALNVFVSREAAITKAIRRYGDELQNILLDSIQTQVLVSVTLGNGKVYIGAVTEMPNLDPRAQYVVIIPMFSGYRRADDKRMVLTTAYWPLYERILAGEIEGPNIEEFEILFPASEVKSANRFDPEFYKGHFGDVPRVEDRSATDGGVASPPSPDREHPSSAPATDPGTEAPTTAATGGEPSLVAPTAMAPEAPPRAEQAKVTAPDAGAAQEKPAGGAKGGDPGDPG